MSRKVNNIGQRFGKLVVIDIVGVNNETHRTDCLCKCDCGNEKVINQHNLLTGTTNSCGCSKTTTSTHKIIALLHSYTKQKAKERDIDFKLSHKDIENLVFCNCYYCGNPPSKVRKKHPAIVEILYNGIDRVDNSKGYEINNVVPCCEKCNKAKMTMTTDEFRDWVIRIYKHMSEVKW